MRALPNKNNGLKQITPESSPESSAKSLSRKFFGVPFLSLINRGLFSCSNGCSASNFSPLKLGSFGRESCLKRRLIYVILTGPGHFATPELILLLVCQTALLDSFSKALRWSDLRSSSLCCKTESKNSPRIMRWCFSSISRVTSPYRIPCARKLLQFKFRKQCSWCNLNVMYLEVSSDLKFECN